MYCPACGIESTQGLNYCKHCGANLTVSLLTTGQRPDGLKGGHFAFAIASLSVGTAVVTLGGLGIVLAFVGDMSHQPNSGDLARLILVIGLPMICAISVLLVWQISRLISSVRQSPSAASEPPRQAVAAYPPLSMAAAPVVDSVTEHTTRNFDPNRLRRQADE